MGTAVLAIDHAMWQAMGEQRESHLNIIDSIRAPERSLRGPNAVDAKVNLAFFL